MMTKPVYWNADKNRKLIGEHSISFEEIVFSLQNGSLLDDTEHPNSENYAHQRVFVVNINDYLLM